MRTSEDAPQSGLYVSECCGQELVFFEGGTLWRCPRCHYLCQWELIEDAVTPCQFERRHTEVTGAVVGGRSSEQVDGWIGAANIKLTQEALEQIARGIKRTGAGTGPSMPPGAVAGSRDAA